MSEHYSFKLLRAEILARPGAADRIAAEVEGMNVVDDLQEMIDDLEDVIDAIRNLKSERNQAKAQLSDLARLIRDLHGEGDDDYGYSSSPGFCRSCGSKLPCVELQAVESID